MNIPIWSRTEHDLPQKLTIFLMPLVKYVFPSMSLDHNFGC
jgi:hypothetical protein